MKLQTAERKRVKLRLNISSPSGFGKTYSSLLLAYGITNDWSRIAVIDTENESASLYSHLGEFKSLPLEPPFSPDRYIHAIKACEEQADVIIIDSITHVWKGQGGLLEYQNALGGKYQDWAKATPLYNAWLNAILRSKCHVITTCRKKQAFNMITEGNRTRVEKAGLEDEIRDGFEYEVTVALEIINDKHLARASKDRTGLFSGKPEFVITSDTGKLINNWCNQGSENLALNGDIVDRINDCKSVAELVNLYKLSPEHQQSHLENFKVKRQELESTTFHNKLNLNSNGAAK